MPVSLPEAFVTRTAALLGPEEAAALCQALTATPPVSIRLNRAKGTLPPAGATPVAWCADGYYLAERPSFTLDPRFHAGAYYVQEAASMFIAQAFAAIGEPVRRVLDLCAAPGGKSTLWRSLLPDGALLVANEPLRQRAQILAENMAKWGQPDVCVTNAYPADFAPLTGFFDVVAADVPCSGEGMFRKDAAAIGEWSATGVGRCAERQMDIVRDVWPALRQGGWLVYSTCTFNREENEDNVRRICDELGAEPVSIPTAGAWDVCGDTTGGSLPVAHFFPHRTRGEGFFLALLRKTAPAAQLRQRRNGRRTGTAPISGTRELASWLATDGFRLVRTDETHIAAVRDSLADDCARLAETVRTMSLGITLAEEKGRKRVPAIGLALSTARSVAAFPTVGLSYDEAISYLRREALTLSPDVPRGYVVATYEGLGLGFLNNLGARANNLYPAEWRIRMQA